MVLFVMGRMDLAGARRLGMAGWRPGLGARRVNAGHFPAVGGLPLRGGSLHLG